MIVQVASSEPNLKCVGWLPLLLKLIHCPSNSVNRPWYVVSQVLTLFLFLRLKTVQFGGELKHLHHQDSRIESSMFMGHFLTFALQKSRAKSRPSCLFCTLENYNRMKNEEVKEKVDRKWGKRQKKGQKRCPGDAKIRHQSLKKAQASMLHIFSCFFTIVLEQETHDFYMLFHKFLMVCHVIRPPKTSSLPTIRSEAERCKSQ